MANVKTRKATKANRKKEAWEYAGIPTTSHAHKRLIQRMGEVKPSKLLEIGEAIKNGQGYLVEKQKGGEREKWRVLFNGKIITAIVDSYTRYVITLWD